MKTLIFDFDGVFTDSFEVSLKAFQELHEQFNIDPITREELLYLFCGNLWEEHKKYGLSGEQGKSFKSELLKLVENRQNEISFFQEIPDTIKKIAELDFSLVIISSNKTSTIKDKLTTVQLQTAFDKVLGADMPGNKQEKLKAILKNTNSGEGFFITDTVGDIKEVKDLPIKTVAVSWGFHSKDDLKKVEPDFLIDEPKELLDILK